MLFSFNNYWKNRNYLSANSPREYNLTAYQAAGLFYAAQIPAQANTTKEIEGAAKLLQM